jgi:hypothetical protein
MIHYLFKTIFHDRKVIIIHLSVLSYVILLFLLFDGIGNTYERILFKKELEVYQISMIKSFLLYILWFFILLLTMDHDSLYHALIYPFFSRLFFDFSKLVVYIMTYTYLFLLIIFTTEVFFYIYLNTQMFLLKSWVLFYLDGFISLIIFLFLIKNSSKTFSLIIPLNLLIIHLIFSDQHHIFAYYLFPLFHPFFDTYLLAIPYKVWYICFWLLLYMLKSVNRRIYA